MKKERRYRWALWTGLALWALGLGGAWVLQLTGREPEGQDVLMSVLQYLLSASKVAFVVLLVVQVFLEELAFRFWGIGKPYAYVVSAVLMSAFMGLELGSIWWFAVPLVLVLCIAFLPQVAKQREVVLLCLTSVLFMLAHVSGFSTFSLEMVFGLVDILGFALVLCYLVINYHFMFAVLLHLVNNTVALGLEYKEMTSKSYEDDHFQVTLLLQSPFDKSPSVEVGDTLQYCGSLSEMAVQLFNESAEAGWRADKAVSLEPNYKMVAVCKDTVQGQNRKALLVQSLLQRGLVRADTLREPVYYLQVSPEQAVVPGGNYTLREVAEKVNAMYFRGCVLPSVGEEDRRIQVPMGVFSLSYHRVDADTLLQRLHQDCGVELVSSQDSAWQVVFENPAGFTGR